MSHHSRRTLANPSLYLDSEEVNWGQSNYQTIILLLKPQKHPFLLLPQHFQECQNWRVPTKNGKMVKWRRPKLDSHSDVYQIKKMNLTSSLIFVIYHWPQLTSRFLVITTRPELYILSFLIYYFQTKKFKISQKKILENFNQIGLMWFFHPLFRKIKI